MDRLNELRHNVDMTEYNPIQTCTISDDIIFHEKVETIRVKLREIEEETKMITNAIQDQKFGSKFLESSNSKVISIMCTLKRIFSRLEIPENKVDIINMYKNRFNVVIIAYRKVLDDFKNKSLVRFRMSSSTMGLSNSEIINLMEQGTKVEDLIKTQIMEGSVVIDDATSNVKSKYDEVILLEKSVNQIHQLFLDMAFIVDEQGELLSSIEVKVKESSDFIDGGNDYLIESIEHQKSINKKYCCIALIVLMIVGTIVAVIAASLS